MLVLFVLAPIALGWAFALFALVLVFCEVGPSPGQSARVMGDAARWGAFAGSLIGVALSILLVHPFSLWELMKGVFFAGVSGAGWVGLPSGIMYWLNEAQNARLFK